MPSPLRQDMTAFLIDRQARQLSPRTIEWYEEKLGTFADFADRMGLNSLFDLTPSLVCRYLVDLADSHHPGGVHGFYRALRALVNWYQWEFEPEG